MQHHRIVFILIWYFIALFSFTVTVNAQEPDPLAELEAWNKIKESTVAADYHAFLQKFPNGSLAARAREKMNTLGDPVWNELKKSNDPFRYRDYIKANPNSPFLDQAKARLEVLTVAAVEWEKVRATDDLTTIMKYISSNPSGPFTEDAKKLIEARLWAATVGPDALSALEFYSLNFQGTERAREAAIRLAALKRDLKEAELKGITERLLSANGHKAILRPTLPGWTAEDVWFENRLIDQCSIEFTMFRNPPNHEFVYRSQFTINLKLVRKIDLWSPGPQDPVFSYIVALIQNEGSRVSQIKHSLRKSKSGLRPAYGPFYETTSDYVVVFQSLDAQRAKTFFTDLNRLRELCN